MTALTKLVDLEESHKGIRASVIFPGEVDTPILEDRPLKVSHEHRARMLQPEDIAAALFVATLPPRACVSELVIKPTHYTVVVLMILKKELPERYIVW